MQELVSNSEIAQHPVVLLYFSAAWCAPCRVFRPKMQQLSVDLVDAVTVLHVNVDSHKGLVGEYGIQSVPTVVGLVNGIEVSRFSGTRSLEELVTYVTGLT